MEEISRYRGSLLGLAVGDALGTTVEFSPPGTFAPVTDIVGGGPFHLQAGEWTDDTSLALCLATSLVACHGFDPADQLRRYLRWWQEGYLSSNGRCFDIGTTTRTALHRFLVTGEPYCGSTGTTSASNGSLMRLAPIPLLYARHPQEAISQAAASSRTTHGSPVACDACRYLAALLVGALQGLDKADLLAELYSPVNGLWQRQPLHPEIEKVARGSFKDKQPPEIRGWGSAVHALEAALWAFYRSDSFQAGCLLAVNLGDDADTTGAIYGQLAGAYYGESGIPASWLAKLAQRALIAGLADKLYDQRQ